MEAIRAYYEKLGRRAEELRKARRKPASLSEAGSAVASVLLAITYATCCGLIVAASISDVPSQTRTIICAAVAGAGICAITLETGRAALRILRLRRHSQAEAEAASVSRNVEAALSSLGTDPQVTTCEAMRSLGERLDRLEEGSR